MADALQAFGPVQEKLQALKDQRFEDEAAPEKENEEGY